jgi:hypothetical protein
MQAEPEAEAAPPEAMASDTERHAVVMKEALPAYLDGDVRLFNFAEDGIRNETLQWFFLIQDELKEDCERGGGGPHAFYDQGDILAAFVKGNLFGLCMTPTDSLFKNVKGIEDPHFMRHGRTGRHKFRFPILCAVENNRITELWVATRMRMKGLARLMLCLQKENGVSGANYVELAVPFWARFGRVTGDFHKRVDFF